LPNAIALAATVALGPMAARAELPLDALLATEFATEAGDARAAAAWSLRVADALPEPVLAERAARLAMVADDRPAFDRAVARWQVLAPASPAREALRLSVSLKQGEYEDALALARDLLPAEGGVERVVQALVEPLPDAGVMARAVLRGLLREPLPPRIEIWLALAGAARRLSDAALAGQWTAALVQRFPDDPRAGLLQAERLAAAGQRDRARSEVRRVLSRSDLPADTRRIAAEALAVLGDPAGAARALGTLPADVRLLTLRAAWLLQAGDMAGLRAVRGDAMRLQAVAPSAPLALLLGEISERLLDWPAAEGWYRPLQAGSAGEQARLRLGIVLGRQQRDAEALRVLRALQADEAADGESRRQAWQAEAELHEARRRPAQAEAALVRGLAVLEDDPVLLVARAGIAQRRGEATRAEALLREVLARDPEDAPAWRALGLLLLAGQRFADAEPALRTAFTAAPSAALAAAWGEALWRLDRIADARSAWARGDVLDPDDPVLADTRRRLERVP
jgi:tetratricopeptide (TPR) repeat protein